MPYFDHAATTKPYDKVINTIADSMRVDYHNPASLYKSAKDISRKINQLYKEIAKNLNCDESELVHTSGGTESTNMALKGLYNKYGHRLNKIIASTSDHDATLNTLKFLKTQGANIILINTKSDGSIDIDELEDHLDNKTLAISILYVNNETVKVQDLDTINKLLIEKAPQAKIHLDLVQALGKIKIDLNSMPVDLASFSGHKIHGPKSSGLLYIKSGTFPEPLIHGGGQQNGWRSGTEDYPLLSGLSLAINLACNYLEKNNNKVVYLRNQLLDKIKDLDFKINFPNSIPQILSISFPKYRGETLLHMLEAKDIYISTSSACNAKSGAISHVLSACNIDRKQAEGTLRISIDHTNTMSEIEYLAQSIIATIKELESWEI